MSRQSQKYDVELLGFVEFEKVGSQNGNVLLCIRQEPVQMTFQVSFYSK